VKRVVDASVIVKLYRSEEHSDAADRLLRETTTAPAPELIWVEIANVF
jgi:predicted nucleic acid-binding protein